MGLFGGGRGGESRGERSAREREEARLERERRRAAREGRPLPEAAPPPPVDEPRAEEPPPAAEPAAWEEPPPAGQPAAWQEAAPAEPVPPVPEPAAWQEAAPAEPAPPVQEPAPTEPGPSWFDPAPEEPAAVEPPPPVEQPPPPVEEPPPPVEEPPPPVEEPAPEPPAAPVPDDEPLEWEEPTRAQEPVPAPAPPPAPVEPPTQLTGERPLGTKRAASPTVRDLPQVKGPVDRTPKPPKPRGLPKQRRGMRRSLLLLPLLLLLAVAWFANALLQPFGEERSGDTVRVTIPQGAGAREIGDLLAEKGIVDSGFYFNLRARLDGQRNRLKAGEFELSQEMSYGAALDVLTGDPAPPPVVRLTLAEGPSIRETERRLDQADTGLRGDYSEAVASERRRFRPSRFSVPSSVRTLEGFLFPATYELEPRSTYRRLVREQLKAFEAAYQQLDLTKARRAKLTPYDVLIIASMIEREALVPKERRVISAVIYNRLKRGIPLGIDATIRYREDNWDRPLRVSELERDSPFNTRKRQGLPPTPIGNPGLAAIKAAANPTNDDFLFYVVKPCGNGAHAFSTNDAQFQRDVAAYNKARDERGGRDPSRC